MSGSVVQRSPRVSCCASSSVSKNICRFPVHNSIATDEIFPKGQQDVLYKNTYLSKGITQEIQSPSTPESNSVKQCSSDQQILTGLIIKSSPHAVKILGSLCLEYQNRDGVTIAPVWHRTHNSSTPQSCVVANAHPQPRADNLSTAGSRNHFRGLPYCPADHLLQTPVLPLPRPSRLCPTDTAGLCVGLLADWLPTCSPRSHGPFPIYNSQFQS